jgi:CheY-like chemotaxis protein
VDDDSCIRALLEEFLVQVGRTVLTACDGDAAMKVLQDGRQVDLVVLDIIMPNKEGLETTREIRRDYPDTKIIAMSAGGRGRAENYLAVARKLGAHAILSKPFDCAHLLRLMNELLDVTSTE